MSKSVQRHRHESTSGARRGPAPSSGPRINYTAQMKSCRLLGGIVVRVVEHEVGEDDEDALFAVPAELVVAVERGGVRLRIVGRRERAVLGDVAPEDPVARRTCPKHKTKHEAMKLFQPLLHRQSRLFKPLSIESDTGCPPPHPHPPVG